MSNKAGRRTNVAAVILKLDCQYCVNIAAAVVKVTMLIQFANLRRLAVVRRQALSSVLDRVCKTKKMTCERINMTKAWTILGSLRMD